MPILKSGLAVPADVAFRMVCEEEKRQSGVAALIEGELRQMDHRLRVRYFESDHGVPWIKPGRWHVIRLNDDGAPPSAMPIEQDGKFCEPHSGVIDELRRRDSWKLKGTLHEHVRAHMRKEQEELRRKGEDARENMKEEFVLAAKAYMTPRPTLGRVSSAYRRSKSERSEIERLNSRIMRKG